MTVINVPSLDVYVLTARMTYIAGPCCHSMRNGRNIRLDRKGQQDMPIGERLRTFNQKLRREL